MPAVGPLVAWDFYFLSDDVVARARDIENLIWAPLRDSGHPLRRARKHEVVTEVVRKAAPGMPSDDQIAEGIDHALATYEVQRMKSSMPSRRSMLDGVIRELRAKQRRPGKTVLVRIEAI